MKRTRDDSVKQHKQTAYNQSNCYLSETAEIRWFKWEKLREVDIKACYDMGDADITLKVHGDQNQNFTVCIEPFDDTDLNFCLALESQEIDLSKQSQWKIISAREINLQLKQSKQQKEFEKENGETATYSEVFQQLLKENLTLICWQENFLEEEIKKLELTDCIIRSQNICGEIIYRADVKKLVSSSEVLYNMVKDLNENNYNPENPLDLTEIFKEFHPHSIRMYLCCVYNKDFDMGRLINIIFVLSISVKLNNQRVIQQILDLEQLGGIVREQVVWDDPSHPCYLQNVLDFANKHAFHQLLAFCALSLVDKCQEFQSKQMKEILKIYGNR